YSMKRDGGLEVSRSASALIDFRQSDHDAERNAPVGLLALLGIDRCDSWRHRGCEAGGNVWMAMQWQRSLVPLLALAMLLLISGCGQGASSGETGQQLLSVPWVAA